MTDTLIRNIKYLKDGEWAEVELAIEGECIADIGESLSGPARREIDGGGAYCLAGAVDLHVHFNEPGRTDWEGFGTGSAAAAAGGVTYVAEMPLNSIPSTTSVEALRQKQSAIGQQSQVDFGLWGGVVPGNAEDLLPLAEAGVMGFKAFMSPSGTDEFANSDTATLREAMKRIAPTGLRLAVHAEDPAVLRSTEKRMLRKETATHWEASRPVEAEMSAVRALIELAGETGCPLTIVHVSAPDVLELIQNAKAQGVDICCETCPHYLLLSVEEAEAIGPLAKCAPPLRAPEMVEAMQELLASGWIDTIGSDHSPCPPKLKEGKRFYEAWGGIAGVQHGLPFLLDMISLHDAERLTVLQKAFAETPAAVAGLPRKGTVRVGADADFFLVEGLESPATVRSEDLLYRHRVSAYTGFDLELKLASTWLRGQPVVESGRLSGTARGRFIPGPGGGRG